MVTIKYPSDLETVMVLFTDVAANVAVGDVHPLLQ